MMNKLLTRPNAGIAVLAITATFLYSCNSSKTVQGGAVGAAAGGVIGAVIGNQSGSTVEGAIFGAMVGGAAGLIIGDIMDKQTKKLQSIYLLRHSYDQYFDKNLYGSQGLYPTS